MRAACRALVAAFGWFLLLPDAAAGQSEWRITPGLGFYLPASPVVDAEGLSQGAVLEMKQLATGAGGLQVGFLTGPVVVEAGAAYSPSLVAIKDGERTRDVSAGVFLGSLRVLARVLPREEPGGWGLDAGVGLIWLDRWGEAWEPFIDPSSTGASLTAGLSHQLKGAPVRVRLEVTDYVYGSGLRHVEHGPLEGHVQHDFVWGLGIVIPL